LLATISTSEGDHHEDQDESPRRRRLSHCHHQGVTNVGLRHAGPQRSVSSRLLIYSNNQKEITMKIKTKVRAGGCRSNTPKAE
jgi:hypothetical protein